MPAYSPYLGLLYGLALSLNVTLAPFITRKKDVNFLLGNHTHFKTLDKRKRTTMKLIGAILLFGGLLFAAVGICQNPFCGHPKFTHGKGGGCAYDNCTRFHNR